MHAAGSRVDRILEAYGREPVTVRAAARVRRCRGEAPEKTLGIIEVDDRTARQEERAALRDDEEIVDGHLVVSDQDVFQLADTGLERQALGGADNVCDVRVPAGKKRGAAMASSSSKGRESRLPASGRQVQSGTFPRSPAASPGEKFRWRFLYFQNPVAGLTGSARYSSGCVMSRDPRHDILIRPRCHRSGDDEEPLLQRAAVRWPGSRLPNTWLRHREIKALGGWA